VLGFSVVLRLHLPPNFAAAVGRNAVPLRVELDLAQAPAPELLPVLALLQRWCGTAPPKFIQLSRAQLRDLAAAAGPQPLFVDGGQVGPWRHDALLAEPASGTEGGSSSSGAAGQTPKFKNRNSAPPAPGMIVDGSEHFLAITLPSREHRQYDGAVALLRENGFTLEPSNRKWWLRDRHKTLNFLAEHLGELRTRFGAEFTPNFEKNTARIRPAEVSAEVDAAGRGFSVAVGIRAGESSEAELRGALASNRAYVESSGTIYLIDAVQVRQLATVQRALVGDHTAAVEPRRTVTVSPARVTEVQQLIEEISPNFQAPAAWRERGVAIKNLTALPPAPLASALEGQLRPYQRLGIAWLWHLQRHGLAGVLADEMGLGKTLQALAMLSAGTSQETAKPASVGRTMATASRPAPRLVVCPASLLENWRREAVRFTPDLRVFVHHGDHRLAEVSSFAAWDLVITSYGTLTRDQSLFSAVEFDTVVADEAQHIKNRRSQNAAALRSLRARARFVLTGTPVENALDDLRSLFEFLLPGYLTRVPAGLRGDERAWYDDRLRAQTAPYILRRTKKAVAPELPDKIEQIVWCELAPPQAAIYRETQERLERELFDLEAGGASEAKLKFAALTQLLRLRQICCDPRLIEKRPAEEEGANSDHEPTAGGEGRIATEAPGSGGVKGRNAQPVPPYSGSAKLDAFRELLEEAIDDGHRVLVFSQFTSLLALLRAELDARELAYCYLDGSMAPKARQAEVDRFQQGPEIPLFLLSLKAGGTGLNLTGADTVVHYDPWWNPAVEAQATDRAHRIGQKRTVTSYKLIASGTVEEKVLALQTEKRALLADVFEASDAVAAKLSLADLRGLLR
jgi:superfamily II DNA or RNA helicase